MFSYFLRVIYPFIETFFRLVVTRVRNYYQESVRGPQQIKLAKVSLCTLTISFVCLSVKVAQELEHFKNLEHKTVTGLQLARS